MKKYNSMKSSNVLWLGDIPEHWECLKIGILFSQRKVKVSDKDYAPLSQKWEYCHNLKVLLNQMTVTTENLCVRAILSLTAVLTEKVLAVFQN